MVRGYDVTRNAASVTTRVSRPPQACYRWLAHLITDAELVEAQRASALLEAHGDDPEFEYRCLADEAHEAGLVMAEHRVEVCADNGWWRRSTSSAGRAGGSLAACP